MIEAKSYELNWTLSRVEKLEEWIPAIWAISPKT